ncbi:sugar phosphate isomerase/epimerase [Mycetocola tolaasinivorans]|uniref:Sugar phosphate isomerase/epimerase n=1 Tax=Mycetocola tolaasinivorans TaxID=76635 RepID=A0A3L7A647_9MICO|nr:sugar phosphate isomerase/epimerase [Mycetocola tolaasinivorans]RLP75300.1 sugar phosphate isomerase/epimerase [Mycetocola tolaasinivorans]
MTSNLLTAQLYSVRHALAEDRAATLTRLAEIGFKQIETFGFNAESVADIREFAEYGLAVPSAHSNFLGKGLDVSATFAAAAEAGVGTVIEPFLPAEHFADADAIKKVADQLNAAADLADQHGVVTGYHNHAWEAEGLVEGVTPIEYLASLLDPRVTLEIDTYWAQVGGQNPIDLLGRLGERVSLLHIKDGDASRDVKNQLPAGSGVLDVLGIIAAAPHATPVAEFDDYAGDIFEGLQTAFNFLTKNGVQA